MLQEYWGRTIIVGTRENEGETKNGGETGDRESSTAIGVKQRMQCVTGGEYKGQIHMALTYSTDDLC